MSLSIILFFLVGFFLTSWLVKSFKHNHFVGMLAGMLACMVLVYCIIPILILLLKDSFFANNIVYGFDELYSFIFRTTKNTNYAILFINFSVGIIGLYLGYKSVMGNTKTDYSFDETCYYRTLFRKVSLYSLIIGGLSLIVYVYALGGLRVSLAMGNQLRGFSSEIQVDSFLTLFKVPATIIQLAFYVSTVSFFTPQWRFHGNLIVMITSLLLTIVYMLINAGKTNVMILLLFIFFLYFRRTRRNPWPLLLVGMLLSVPLLGMLDYIFDHLAFGDESGVDSNIPFRLSVLMYIRSFSYPFQTELHINDIVDKYGLLYFQNLITDPLSFLPGIAFPASFENTSEFFGGYNWREVSGLPNDILSYGYLNLFFIGTFIHVYVWGKIAGYVDKWMATAPLPSLIRESLGFVLAFKAFSHVLSTDWSSIIIDLTLILLFIIVYKTRLKHI